MRLILRGFRCYVEQEFVIPDGMVSLLRGPSGAGKSSIFNAIFWCLYGSLHHVDSYTTSKRCSVAIELHNLPLFSGRGIVWDLITIYRQKRPGLFSITCSQENGAVETYQDQIAQKMIEETFGTKELFLASSYLPQGSRALLITASNGEKMDLLNRISFNTEDPDEVIEKIDEELTTFQNKFNTEQSVLTMECERFNKELSAAALDMSVYCQGGDREKIRQESESLKNECSKLSEYYVE